MTRSEDIAPLPWLPSALAAVAVCTLYSGAVQWWHTTRGGMRPLYVVAALLLGSVLHLATQPHRPTAVLRSPVLLWAYCYLLLSTAWLLWGTVPDAHATQALVDRYRSMAFVLAMVIVFDDAAARRIGGLAVVAIAVAASVGNVAEELGLVTFVDSMERTAGRAGGLHGNANQSGLVIVFGLAAGLAAVPRLLRVPALLVCALGVAATFSRGAMLCYALLVVVLVWRKELPWVPSALAAAGVVAALTVVGTRVESLLDSGGALNTDTLARLSMTADDSGRSHLAWKVWNLFLDSPWTGWGLSAEGPGGRISHNMYLSLAAEHGALGLAVFPALVLAIVVRHAHGLAFALVFLVAGSFGHGFLEQEPSLLCAALAAARFAGGGVRAPLGARPASVATAAS